MIGPIVRSMFEAAVAAVDPAALVEAALRRLDVEAGEEPVLVLALGKAAAGMAAGVEAVFGPNLVGVAAVVEPVALPGSIHAVVGGHPLPDEGSLRAGRALMEAAAAAAPDQIVVVLVSGGGSALAELPVPGVSLGDLVGVQASLLRDGADISQLNMVRQALSRLKGGGLGAAVASNRLVTLALSDVGRAGAATIASGPTVPVVDGPEAVDVLARFGMTEDAEPRILEAMRTSAPRRAFEQIFEVVGDGAMAAAAAARAGEERGLRSSIAVEELSGEARDAARRIVDIGTPNVPGAEIHAGETTVTVIGDGRGGRNHEAALAAAVALDGSATGVFLAAGTDGVDGDSGGAGAIVDGETIARARQIGVDAARFLDANDSGRFFDRVPGRLMTGPTGTNVADIWIMATGA